jgi:hypothetical protein
MCVQAIDDLSLWIVFEIDLAGVDLGGDLSHVGSEVLEDRVVQLVLLFKVVDHVGEVLDLRVARLLGEAKLEELREYLHDEKALPDVLRKLSQFISVLNLLFDGQGLQDVRESDQGAVDHLH